MLVPYKFNYIKFEALNFTSPTENIGELRSKISLNLVNGLYTLIIAPESLFFADFNRVRINEVRFIRAKCEPIKIEHHGLTSFCVRPPLQMAAATVYASDSEDSSRYLSSI